MPENKFTPAYDNKIYQKYSQGTIQNKEKNKIAFCQDYDLSYDKRVPLIAISYGLTDKNNVQMIQDVMNGILEQPVQVVLCGVGTEKYQKYFTELTEKFSHQIVIVDDSEETKRKLYAAADMALIPSESQECLEEAKNTMAYGAVPVIMATDFAQDYDPVREKGNAFVYKKDSPWSLFATFIRALENYRFPYDWKNIQVAAMEPLA